MRYGIMKNSGIPSRMRSKCKPITAGWDHCWLVRLRYI
jgi:hypothetical protein